MSLMPSSEVLTRYVYSLKTEFSTFPTITTRSASLSGNDTPSFDV